MEIYEKEGLGMALLRTFTFVIPVLIAVNVPARILVRPLHLQTSEDWFLAGFAVLATVASLAVSRWIFHRALLSYRSASS